MIADGRRKGGKCLAVSAKVHIFADARTHLKTRIKHNKDMKEEQKTTMADEQHMREAIRLATENVAQGGGPFGAVIVRDGQVLATGVNRVTANNDPTAHAEVSAIREACRRLGTYDLSGAVIYSSCEPCPMCLGAIYWARIKHVYCGCNQQDADRIGFSDAFIYQELDRPKADRQLGQTTLLHDEAQQAFRAWEDKTDRVDY